MICHRDPQMGADEIRRVGHHRQFVGVFTSFSALFEPIGCAKNDPILDAMAEHELVLTAHSEGWFTHFTPLWTGARTWIELFGNAPAGNAMAHLAAMICQGMFDKYPQAEGDLPGGRLLVAPRLHAAARRFLHELRRATSRSPSASSRPASAGSEAAERIHPRHVRFSTQPITIPKNRKHFAWMLELCHAEDLFCFSSDWPHQTMDPANWVVENPDCIGEEMQKKLSAAMRASFTQAGLADRPYLKLRRRTVNGRRNGNRSKTKLAEVNHWDELLALRDRQREQIKNGIQVIKEAELPLEVSRQGLMRWYLHPAIKDTCLSVLLFFQQEIPPGSRSGRLKFQGGQVMMITEGAATR